jgi:hypothetical protein
MKVNLRALAAIVAGVALAAPDGQVAAQAPGQIPAGYAYYNYAQPGQDMYSYDPHMSEPPAGPMATASSPCGCGSGTCTDGCSDIWKGSCDGSCGGSCGGGCGGRCGLLKGLLSSRMGNRQGQWFAGADFLYLRADVSESTAWLDRDVTNINTPVDTFQQADFDYEASYRFFGGYRLSDCCGEILVSYSRYTSESEMVSPAATTSRQFFGAFEVNAIEPGSQLISDIDIDADIYDADFARTLPLGSPLGECNSCNWCPAWDIKWFFGARYADVEWTRDVATTDTIAANSVNISSRTRMDFNGAGPRFGIDGRRYIGRNGNFSVYAKGAISLLMGDVDYVTTAVSATPGVVPTQRANFTRIIPVTDIEAGGSIHLNNNITVTAGYLFSAWHDLGMGDQYFTALTPVVYDDANILGFDGAFARAEISY